MAIGRKRSSKRIATIGLVVRSGNLLSYTPSSTETGYHAMHFEVDVLMRSVFASRLRDELI